MCVLVDECLKHIVSLGGKLSVCEKAVVTVYTCVFSCLYTSFRVGGRPSCVVLSCMKPVF